MNCKKKKISGTFNLGQCRNWREGEREGKGGREGGKGR